MYIYYWVFLYILKHITIFVFKIIILTRSYHSLIKQKVTISQLFLKKFSKELSINYVSLRLNFQLKQTIDILFKVMMLSCNFVGIMII